MEGLEGTLSRDCRGEVVSGVRMEGIDISGIVKEEGCSDMTEEGGGDVGVASLDVRVAGSALVSSSTLTSSSLAAGTTAECASEAFESMLVLLVSAVTAGLRSAGLSGREGPSVERLASAPLLTACANRSCSLELGLVREELRDVPARWLVSLRSQRCIYS
jgi:hypothetical protein